MNSSRVHLERALRGFAASLPDGARVLDAGAGDCCYRPYFSDHAYEAADFAQVEGKTYGTLDYVCDIAEIPVEDGRFDAVFCTQVLAHIPEPVRVLSELRRVLRPGGRLLLTAPLFFQENEPPHDHFRYTRWGLRGVFERAGLEVESLDWLEGYAGTVSYQLKMAARSLPWSPSDYGGGAVGVLAAGMTLVARPAMAALAVVLGRADAGKAYTGKGMCKNYLIVGRRPEGEL